MLPPKQLNDSSLNGFFFSVFNSMNQNKITEPREEKKLLDRQPPALSSNAILLIELGIVLIVILVVGLVFYLSHRNSKKRGNRRRWMQSDVNIDNCNDGQIYDTTIDDRQPNESIAHRRRWPRNDSDDHQIIDPTFEERHPRTIDLDQDDCPPSYESLVQQKKRKRPRNSKCNAKGLDRILPKCHNTNNEETLLSTQSPSYISIICNENSSLIENQQSAASTSSSDNAAFNDTDKVCTERENCLNNDFKVNNHKLQKKQLARRTVDGETETSEKPTTIPTKTVRCANGIAVLDASGLPTYDTALKIQECGNM
ncbi:uncharacterized protein LOC119084169 isoform X2 [Bradysia coprophila]|uniref:uncharacterized protein LOC119084169 isoform X2 n=1 Tax=Bradysia coprophila TaxID=38358 RepID=UPI00187D9AD3|nr:uncharacterized protein LOC119084169 isoform X2 [Bradysia coprophila]